LYYIHRLICHSTESDSKEELTALLAQRAEERIGAPGDALCLAMRVVVCASMGIRNSRDLETLVAMQNGDGGWEPSRLYCFPRLNRWLGNRGVTTAMAIKAIKAMRRTLGTVEEHGAPCPRGGTTGGKVASACTLTVLRTLVARVSNRVRHRLPARNRPGAPSTNVDKM
jgi:hypothetical protein